MSSEPKMLETLRELDRDAYIAALFLPAAKREDIAVLWLFNAEIERIPALVSEPVPGEIRLQWWRDVLSGQRSGEGGQHPVAYALLRVIEAHQLQIGAFDNLLEARIFDLYHDPMPDRATLEGYLGETRSVLFQMSLQVLMGEDPENGDAAGHAGVAFGIAQILRKMAQHRALNQVFVPTELLQSCGMDVPKFLSSTDPKEFDPVIAAMIALGREHAGLAKEAVQQVEKQFRSAFVPLALCDLVFEQAKKAAGQVAIEPLQISALRIQWRMLVRSISI